MRRLSFFTSALVALSLVGLSACGRTETSAPPDLPVETTLIEEEESPITSRETLVPSTSLTEEGTSEVSLTQQTTTTTTITTTTTPAAALATTRATTRPTTTRATTTRATTTRLTTTRATTTRPTTTPSSTTTTAVTTEATTQAPVTSTTTTVPETTPGVTLAPTPTPEATPEATTTQDMEELLPNLEGNSGMVFLFSDYGGERGALQAANEWAKGQLFTPGTPWYDHHGWTSWTIENHYRQPAAWTVNFYK